MSSLNGFWDVFLAAAFGALLTELYCWYTWIRSVMHSHNPSLPPKHPWYMWALYITLSLIWCCSAGLLATYYDTENVKAAMVIHIGASLPLIISKISSNIPRL